MPFYEYECSACKFYVEALQKISDLPLKKCPSCGKETLQRLISAPVFRLKGSGWYETDFKSDKENKRNLVHDKEPAAASAESDDKKVKVRAGKSLKKAAAKKVAKKTAKKTTGKSAKPVKKPVKQAAAKKAPTKKKAVGKKSAKKAVKKPAGKSAARKK